MSKRLITFSTLAVGLAVVVGVWIAKPKPEKVQPEVPAPAVRVAAVTPSSIRLTVAAQGTVTPRREINLVPEISGKIISMSEHFLSGKYFKAGDVLVQIDPRDYEYAVTRAEAQVANARQQLAREEAESAQAKRDWQDLGQTGEPGDLVLRKPQMAEAKAALRAAEAQLAQARLDLERTAIKAPFDGRVRSKSVDLGEYVTPGKSLGQIYSTDVVDIPLPLTDRQLSYLDLPLTAREKIAPVPVTIHATFAGRTYDWRGEIKRTEGAIDPRSRVLYAVAEVHDPFGRNGGGDDKPPLAVGLFVEADIAGKSYDQVFVTPREALREQSQVMKVDSGDRLRFVNVEVLRAAADGAIIRSGLQDGDRLVITPLENAVDGMKVHVLNDEDGETPGDRTAASPEGEMATTEDVAQ